jgi:replicative DNA helicase
MPNDNVTVSEQDWEAEEVLIGSILIQSAGSKSREAINQVSNILKPEDFKGCVTKEPPSRWPRNAIIFHAMTKCELPPHCINVTQTMIDLGILFKAAPAYLYHCESTVPCSLDYLDYAKAVKANSTRRQVKYYAGNNNLKKLNQITQSGFKGGVEGL